MAILIKQVVGIKDKQIMYLHRFFPLPFPLVKRVVQYYVDFVDSIGISHDFSIGKWWTSVYHSNCRHGAKRSSKNIKRKTNVYQLIFNEHVKLMYINCSPINIDLDNSPLLIFILMFLSLFIADISLFIVFSLSVH